MNNEQQKYLQSLEARIDDIAFKGNKNDFSGLQVFNKSIQVQGTIKLKNYSANPAVGTVGELVVVSGKLKVCTVGGTSPTWTVVGTQT